MCCSRSNVLRIDEVVLTRAYQGDDLGSGMLNPTNHSGFGRQSTRHLGDEATEQKQFLINPSNEAFVVIWSV